jgi:hypothetical protein
MSENKTAKTPTDSGTGFIDGVWYGPGPTAWQCQCGRPYTVTCISSKPPKKEWVGLTDGEIDILSCETVKGNKSVNWLCKVLEAKLREKNHG